MFDIGFLFNDMSISFAFLLVAALAALYSERTGVVNIAVNGNMIVGALVFSIFGFYANKDNMLGNNSQFIGILIAMVAGILVSLMLGVAAISLKGNQIIIGTAINIFASAIALFMVTQPQSFNKQYPTNYVLPAIDPKFQIANVYTLLAIGLVIFTFIFFRFTKTGVRYVGAGENPNALYAAGINVIRIRYTGMIISGALGGCAGAIFSFSVGNAFSGNVEGQGFVALAIMIFGQWRVYFIVMGALLFSMLNALAGYLPQIGNTFFIRNNTLLPIVPFVITIASMVIFYKYNNIPLASGQPFQKAKRS